MGDGRTLRRLQEVQFALVELQLYLDMNPDDQRAAWQYKALSAQLAELRQAYEKGRGPLLQYGNSASPDRWTWHQTPWPWEIEY
ncbi:spore coat protein CotJB [Brevibacillus sp. GCM10020057]|uniref:spore coat protein CotJB n=1 Tax=Brevibacillus sp. GCM10020057 TaxID=3317327 RepID=UPI0036259178